MSFYLVIGNLFIQEGIKSILANKFPSYSFSILDSMEDFKIDVSDESPILIIDNPSHIFNNQDMVSNLMARKMMKTVLIANTVQIEQIRNMDKDIKLIDAIIYSNCSLNDLDEALNKVMSGIQYRCKRLESAFKPENLIKEKLKSNEITGREVEIIKLVISGKTSNEIADNLNISYFTVATHRKNINKKLNIKTSHDLTRMFMNEEL